jgi:hypothetical protein
MKIGTRIEAVRDMTLYTFIIKKGSVGKVARISPRLRDCFDRGDKERTIVVKFPRRKSFVALKEEIKKHENRRD